MLRRRLNCGTGGGSIEEDDEAMDDDDYSHASYIHSMRMHQLQKTKDFSAMKYLMSTQTA
jgi:hypothetical protein